MQRLTIQVAVGIATLHMCMPEVVENRIGWNQLPPNTDPATCVALLDCDLLGQPVIVNGFPATVCDCAQRDHRSMLMRRGWAIDLSPELAALVQLPATVEVYGIKAR